MSTFRRNDNIASRPLGRGVIAAVESQWKLCTTQLSTSVCITFQLSQHQSLCPTQVRPPWLWALVNAKWRYVEYLVLVAHSIILMFCRCSGTGALLTPASFPAPGTLRTMPCSLHPVSGLPCLSLPSNFCVAQAQNGTPISCEHSNVNCASNKRRWPKLHSPTAVMACRPR